MFYDEYSSYLSSNTRYTFNEKSMITVQALTYSYTKGRRVLEDLTFNVPKGSLFGFLGANGSGKTTTIRLILGLCQPESGHVLVEGIRMDAPTNSIYEKIGAMIEQPSLYGHLTGEENLQLNALYHGLGKQGIEKTLSLVGLKHVGNKRASTYSLGMKQRLGLALSLLHNPELIVLDEPLNGLDPKGIAEIRDLLLLLVKKEGRTIFMSSHLLGEVETTCDAICVIDNGKKLFSGSIDELRRGLTTQGVWRIECDKPIHAMTLMDSTMEAQLAQTGDAILVQTTDKKRIAALNKQLVESGIGVYALTPVERNLEELYIKLTHGNK